MEMVLKFSGVAQIVNIPFLNLTPDILNAAPLEVGSRNPHFS